MSTRSTIGYIDENGEFRGAYVHHDGMMVGREATKFLKENGYEETVAYIDAGIAGGGYRSFGESGQSSKDMDGSPITAGDYFSSNDLEYAWVVTSETVVPLETYLHEEKTLDLAYWDAWTDATTDTEVPYRSQILAVEKLSEERHGAESPVHAYILTRTAKLLAELP